MPPAELPDPQRIGDTASIGRSVRSNQMFYAGFELQSNIWLAERRLPGQK